VSGGRAAAALAPYPGSAPTGGHNYPLSERAPFAKVPGDARKIVVSNQRLEFTWRDSQQTARRSGRGIIASRPAARPLLRSTGRAPTER
jgi:hypothetical protein